MGLLSVQIFSAMVDPRTDQIAREAARLIQTGRVEGVESAIRAAAELLQIPANVPLPGHGRVRKHAQAMSMQALGDIAYNQQRQRIWQIAEELMATIEHSMADVTTLLVGRSAAGHIDAGVTIRIRLYTHRPIDEIAAVLVQYGYSEPAFETAKTRFGRLSRLRLVEEDIDVMLTRCLPEMISSSGLDLVTGKPIETLDHAALQRRMEEYESTRP